MPVRWSLRERAPAIFGPMARDRGGPFATPARGVRARGLPAPPLATGPYSPARGNACLAVRRTPQALL